jgi:hypothetical protein
MGASDTALRLLSTDGSLRRPPEHGGNFQTLRLGFEQHLYIRLSLEPSPTPVEAGAHPPMFLGVCGLLFALLVGSGDKNATGIAVGIGVISVVFLLAGTGAKKSLELVKWAGQDSNLQVWLEARPQGRMRPRRITKAPGPPGSR